MPSQYKHTYVLLMTVLSLLTARCTPTEGMMAQSPDENRGYVTEPTSQTTSISNPEVQQTPVMQTTPSPTVDPSNAQPGEVASGSAEAEMTQNDQMVSDELELEEIEPATWQVYTDDIFHFSISHPPYYVIKHLDDTELAELSPSPLAAIYFQDQQNELAEIAPPEFSIRVFENKTGKSIEDWLTTAGLLKREAGWFTEPYKGKYVSGVKVVTLDFKAPGWFVYVADNTYVFQLTPLGLGTEAELMLDTFAIAR